jgi:hypothetical protein
MPLRTMTWLQALGRPQEAILCYQRSIQLRPDFAIAYGM